jgi:hypothetical protein
MEATRDNMTKLKETIKTTAEWKETLDKMPKLLSTDQSKEGGGGAGGGGWNGRPVKPCRHFFGFHAFQFNHRTSFAIFEFF